MYNEIIPNVIFERNITVKAVKQLFKWEAIKIIFNGTERYFLLIKPHFVKITYHGTSYKNLSKCQLKSGVDDVFKCSSIIFVIREITFLLDVCICSLKLTHDNRLEGFQNENLLTTTPY